MNFNFNMIYVCLDENAHKALTDEIAAFLDTETCLPNKLEFDSTVVGLVDAADIADVDYTVVMAVYKISDLGNGKLRFERVETINEMVDRLYSIRIFYARQFGTLLSEIFDEYDADVRGE